MTTYTTVNVIPDVEGIRAVDNSPGIVRIDLGPDAKLIFSTTSPDRDGVAVLDRLAAAVAEARLILASHVSPVPA